MKGKEGKSRGGGEKIQRHMATRACGQGAIQSNEITLGREKEKKNDEGQEGGREGEERTVGNITSLCVYLLRTMATV